MKLSDFIDDEDRYNLGQLDEDILFEMSNFRSRVTGLPANIELWVRSDPVNHGHTRYRVKILKDRQWAAIYSVSQNPELIKNINNTLSISENNEIIEFIKKVSSLIIQLIDSKIDTGEFEYEVVKIRGS
jgi:hypothetical protein